MRAEGEAYLSTPVVKIRGDADILSWWKVNEQTYPNLSQVAKDILAVQIAQVGVERVFNLARDVIGDRRHRLSAQTIRQIMILRHAILDEQSDDKDDEIELPKDEEDDLLELPANTGVFTVVDDPLSSDSNSLDEEGEGFELITRALSVDEQMDELQMPPTPSRRSGRATKRPRRLYEEQLR